MTPIAIIFLSLSIVLVWGGLISSILFLARKGEVDEYPAETDTTDPAP